MKIKLWILLVTFSGILLSCCNKDMLNDAKIGYFPNDVGSYWEYQCFDSISSISDTIFVRIKSTVHENGKIYSVWTTEKSSIIFDTALVYTSQDSVIIRGSTIFYSEKIILLPYKLNSKWNSSGTMGDTSIVEGTFTIDALETFKISRRVFGIDLSLDDMEWLAPYVGIMRKNIKEFNIIKPINESWNLIDYSVK
jgi:hypothetical protein